MKCPKCGNMLKEEGDRYICSCGARYRKKQTAEKEAAPNIGYSTSTLPKCPACGTEFLGKFCPNCGHPADGVPVAPSGGYGSKAPKQQTVIQTSQAARYDRYNMAIDHGTDWYQHEGDEIQVKSVGMAGFVFNLIFAVCFGGAGLFAMIEIGFTGAPMWTLFLTGIFALVGLTFAAKVVWDIAGMIILNISGEPLTGTVLGYDGVTSMTVNGNPVLNCTIRLNDSLGTKIVYNTGTTIRNLGKPGSKVAVKRKGELYKVKRSFD